MQVTPYKTKKVRVGDDLYQILDRYLPDLHEKDVVVITSKIVAICQGRVVKNDGSINKLDLMRKEAQLYLPERHIRHGIHLTITHDLFIASAGIDESNGNGYFILWPKDIEKTVNEIWRYLRRKHELRHLGVIITDSHLSPLRRGITGLGIGWCGFQALTDYIGKPDIFGRLLKFTMTNLLDGLAASAVLLMGEGFEQTPLSVISGTPFLQFQNRVPTKKELAFMKIAIADDVFGGLIDSVRWSKGGQYEK